jgi:hypothetical protein
MDRNGRKSVGRKCRENWKGRGKIAGKAQGKGVRRIGKGVFGNRIWRWVYEGKSWGKLLEEIYGVGYAVKFEKEDFLAFYIFISFH